MTFKLRCLGSSENFEVPRPATATTATTATKSRPRTPFVAEVAEVAVAAAPPSLERRRSRVIAELQADPALRYAFDVTNATLAGPADAPVSVLLGLRDASGGILTGELRVPADRWPGPAIFADFWKQASERKPS